MIEKFDIAGYCRISVDEELDRDNTSIENQKAIIEDFVRQRFPECPQAHDVGAQEMRGEQQHNGQPEDASPWQRGCALRRHVHDRGLRRDSRSGVRDLPHLRGLLRPMGKKARSSARGA